MSKIEWTQETWNPITGCSKISEGCTNCYAERMAKRLAGRYGYPKDDPFRPGTIHLDRIDNPPKWSGGKKIFVSSMGDLFHKEVSTHKTYGRIFDAVYMSGYGKFMTKRNPDIYIFLTKRPDRMLKITQYYANRYGGSMPDNAWFGITAENQQRADERIPILLQIPAAVRFVSVEPMLGPVDLFFPIDKYCTPAYKKIDWVICAPETGPKRRPYNIEGIVNLKNQCVETGTPFFLKHLFDGNKKLSTPDLDGQKWIQYPQNK